MTTRKFENSDLSFVQERDFILWLQIQYCGDFCAENTVTAADENGSITGVAALEYHSSWNGNYSNNMLPLNICAENDESVNALVKAAADRVGQLQNENPDKNAMMITFIPDAEKERIQTLLHSGFCFAKCIPVLGYDLSGDIRHYALPDGVTIEPVGRDEAAVEEYLAATGLANGGTRDSKAEYLFRSGDETFLSYRAVSGGKTVGGISVWNIGEDGGATENIFTVPEYRRKNIARELIATAFDELKARGRKQATLSMLGDNANAMKLYQNIGYKFVYNLFMLQHK